MAEKSVSFIIAENLARFFLSHPLITDIYLFGSVAMWGDGDDIDLVLTVSNSGLADEFLQALNKESKKIDEKASAPKDKYGILKALRTAMAFQLLDWKSKHQECMRIYWDGMFEKWNALCVQGQWLEAEKLERIHLRGPDLFLFPAEWQDNERVKTILPSWPSHRPFGAIDFYATVRWQVRRFNSQINTFDERQKLDDSEEQIYRRLRQRERRNWKRRHKR